MDFSYLVKMSDGVIIELKKNPKPIAETECKGKLFSLYREILEGRNLTQKQEKALEVMVARMTEKAAADRYAQDRMIRLSAYATKISQATGGWLADSIMEVLESMEDEDLDSIAILEVNGNNFTVRKEDKAEILEFAKDLFEIGEREKGHTWAAYVENGKLVVY